MRSEFRAHPPDILLTNYPMLEYLLLRGDGRALFRNHAVRFRTRTLGGAMENRDR